MREEMKEIRKTILDCFETRLSATDKIVVDNFLDAYEMYTSSRYEEYADYWYREADKASSTLCGMCENSTEHERLLKVINRLL